MENKTIIETIEAKLNGIDEMLKRLDPIHDFYEQYKDNKDIASFLNDYTYDHFIDPSEEEERLIIKESRDAYETSKKLLFSGKPKEALLAIKDVINLPGFIHQKKYHEFDPRNDFERYMLNKAYKDMSVAKIPFSYISHLVAHCFANVGLRKEAKTYFKNAISWNPYFVSSRLALIDLEMEDYEIKNGDKVSISDLDAITIKNELKNAYLYSYQPDEFMNYFRSLGNFYALNGEYLKADACYNYSKQFLEDQHESLCDINALISMIERYDENLPKTLGHNNVFNIFQKNGILFRFHPLQIKSLYEYSHRDDVDLDTKEMCDSILSYIKYFSLDNSAVIARVRFEDGVISDCIVYENGVTKGDTVLVMAKEPLPGIVDSIYELNLIQDGKLMLKMMPLVCQIIKKHTNEDIEYN